MSHEILDGLLKKQKIIHPKYLYDDRGSEIFEEICKVQEYYPTRCENEILEKYAFEMASLLGPRVSIIEPGCGSGEKVRPLLRALNDPLAYVPIEISQGALMKTVNEIRDLFPDLPLFPVVADFTQELNLPSELLVSESKKVFFFPGSTIGNFGPSEAISFLTKLQSLMDQSGGLLIGVDLKKEKDVLEKAYDDSLGVTASFNLNLLERMNREFKASFDPNSFEHVAFYNEELGRVEMHLKSLSSHEVEVGNVLVRFSEGETIHTESSYKYSVSEFCQLSHLAKLEVKKYWMDTAQMFCVYYCAKEGS